ncbi:MAG: fused MFS/spermidine synthase [Myxococcota bacterium]
MTRGLVLLLTVVTGFSGLVYEVAWQKILATLLGSHSESTAAVLGLFLGGLALGYAGFGRVSQRRPHLLAIYGGVEASIGIWALLFPWLFQGVLSLSLALPATSPGLGFVQDILLSALLIGPPSVLMGATIPLLTQALARSLADATRFHAFVYACNTLGAFGGALAAGFWLVPALGLVGVLRLAATLNLLAGAAFFALDWHSSRRMPQPPPQEPASPQASPEPAEIRQTGQGSRPDLISPAVALLIGFAMMTVQTVLIRLGGMAFGSSQFTFSMVVAVFVLCIALGSFGVSALPRVPRHGLLVVLWGLVGLLALLYLRADEAPYWAHVLRSLFQHHAAAFYPYHVSAFAAVLVIVGPAAVLSGATLPLIFHDLRRQVGELGDVAGGIYSWNTIGSLLGALLGGYALLFWLDIHQIFRVAMGAVVLAAALIVLRTVRTHPAIWAIGLAANSLAAIALLPAWSPERLSMGLFRWRNPLERTFEGADLFYSQHDKTRIVFYKDGPTASIAVKQLTAPDGQIHRSIFTNGKSDSAAPTDYSTTGMLALLPALFVEKAERAFVIGYGTGVTAGELAELSSIREVLVAEISSSVIDAAPLFDFANRNASKAEKVTIVSGDAYRTLLRMDGKFDIITSEPSNPWVAGVEMLYSREFLEAARDRLSPGGVHVQWFHAYETDDTTMAMVLRTYADVFEHVSVWFGEGADLLLLGFRDPDRALDLDRLERRAAQPDIAAGLRRCSIDSFPELLVHEWLPFGVVHATALTGELHTLLHPRLSYHAARAFFTGRTGRLNGTAGLDAANLGARNSFLVRYRERRGGRLPEEVRVALVREACRQKQTISCTTLFAHWSADSPDSGLRRGLEREIRADPDLAGAMRFNLVPALARLYGANGTAPESGDVLETATRATRLYIQYYLHAAPFPRRTLMDLWTRCDADPKLRERCRKARTQLEEFLGDLELDLAQGRS